MALMGHVVLSTQGKRYLDQKAYKANEAGSSPSHIFATGLGMVYLCWP